MGRTYATAANKLAGALCTKKVNNGSNRLFRHFVVNRIIDSWMKAKT